MTDGSSAAGADDFDPITANPASQRVTVTTVTVPGAPRGEERDVTGDRVTRADPPYIVTLRASDRRAAEVRAGNKFQEEHCGRNHTSTTREENRPQGRSQSSC